MEEVRSVFNITLDENDKIIAAFSQEKWKLVQISIKNYNSKLQCSRRCYKRINS